MKRLSVLILAILSFLTTYAQVEHSIIIDQSSFRAVNSDALTGANVDPIAKDSSRNACARVKIQFSGMNRAEVDALTIQFRSNTDLVRQQVDYYDNILILEMTAKPATRFYVQSPDYGQSNEVTLNLEANREYELEARLNQMFSIIVNSNVEGAEVYIDGVMKGRTSSVGSLTISEVTIGSHALKLVYGGLSATQQIEVNKSSISFRQEVNKQASKPQYVVFAVEPATAVVIIDNQHYTLQEGMMQVVLHNGVYNYTVTAAGYHPQSGTFTVAGDKVEKVVSLTADSATITLISPDNAEIWINGTKRGQGSWSGVLNSGTYIFEARKAGHTTSSLSKTITSADANQRFTLPVLTPIVGAIDITSSPLMADVTLDGKPVGRTPIVIENQVVGTHTLQISKQGYAPYSQIVTIAEGKTTTLSATLTKSSTPQNTAVPAQPPVAKITGLTSAPYKVGDYYNDGTLKGVVYQVDATGRKGMLVSLDEAPAMRLSEMDDWCRSKGYGWEIPSIYELKKFAVKGSALDVVNATLRQYGVEITDKSYESSTGEYKSINHIGDSDSFRVFHYYVSGNSVCSDVYRRGQGSSPKRSVRAVCSFTAKYRVGEYYNENGKQGVIFEVSADGNHGKILSMKQSYLCWAEQDSPESKRTIKANSTTDGAYNTDRVHSRPGWQKKYPAFKWCAELGEGWYIPAIEELKVFLLNGDVNDAVNATLQARGGSPLVGRVNIDNSGYLSSTESSYMFDGWCSIYSAHWKNSPVSNQTLKYVKCNVRAVAKF